MSVRKAQVIKNDSYEMSANTGAVSGTVLSDTFSSRVLLTIPVRITGVLDGQGPPTESSVQTTAAEIERAALAFQQHLTMVTEMRDWKRIPTERHGHPQLTSEPND